MVGRPVEIQRTSDLVAEPEAVWSVVSTMDGVNHELGPFLRMTHPADRSALDGSDVPLGEVLFRSWLLAGGVIPFDRHALRLRSLQPGAGFVEESSSWLQRRWRHERTIASLPGGGCRVTDALTIEPRIGVARPVVQAIVGRLFSHRHRRLVARFGARR